MGLVIGLHGAKGSGKDQFFKAVKDAFPGLPIKKIAYADPIKTEVCRIFNLRDEVEYDNFKRTQVNYTIPNSTIRSNEIHQVSGRQVVREIGMLMRRFDESQFVKYVETTIAQEPETIWCVTDLRFGNEFDSIRQHLNGVVVKIKRGGVQYDGHVTETEFADSVCDVVIHNRDITLEQYNQLAVDEFKYLMKGKL